MIKIRTNEEIKKKHFDLLYNKKPENGTFSLKKRLKEKIKEYREKSQVAPDDGDNKKYYKMLKYIKKHIKSILTGQPVELHNHTLKIGKKGINFRGLTSEHPMKKDIKSIFNYDGFKSWKYYNAYELSRALGVSVCPYCNRQYITTYESPNGKTRPELDHFYSQKDYPYLALSLYNLIPSCHICNSNLKGQKEFSLDKNLHPHIEEFGNKIKFTVTPKKKKDEYDFNFFYGESNKFDIKFNPPKNGDEFIEKAYNNIVVFKLQELYNASHKDHVQGLIKKSIIYSEDRINSLFEEFEGTLFKNRDDVIQMITFNYINDNDLGKKPLAKLTKDISEEFGLLNKL